MHRIRFLKKSEKIWPCCVTRKALIAGIQESNFNNVWILKCLRRLFDHSTFSKSFETLLKVTDCMQQLQVRENVVGFEKALGAVKVIKDQIQYRSQELAQLIPWLPQQTASFFIPGGHFNRKKTNNFWAVGN